MVTSLLKLEAYFGCSCYDHAMGELRALPSLSQNILIHIHVSSV